jgi:hypothetical protein
LSGPPPVGSNQGVSSEYRFSQPLVVRAMGAFLAAVGVLVFLLALLVGVLSLPIVVLTVGVVLAVLAVFVVGFLLTRKAAVVRLDDEGYQVRFVRGAGVKQARWKDVEDAVATTLSGERCVVLRLRDGRTTTVPVRVLAGDPNAFVKDLQRHLDRGHGYRRIS